MRVVLPVFLMLLLLGCSREPEPSNAEKLNSGRPNLFGNGATKKPVADADTPETLTPEIPRLGRPAPGSGEITLIPTGRWTDLKPCTPLLELKRDKHGAWAWHHGEKTLAEPGREAVAALREFAKHSHHGLGWQGKAPNGISRNVVVLHVDADAPAHLVCHLIEHTVAAQIGQVAVGLRGAVPTPRDTLKCAQPETLGADYLLYRALIDDGLRSAPSIPKEEAGCIIQWSEADRSISYVTMTGARDRKPVSGLEVELARYLFPPEAAPAARTAPLQLRAQAVAAVADKLHEHVVRSGARIEQLRYACIEPLFESTVPWLALELAWRACEETRRRMEAAGAASVTVAHPWENQFPEPPPPEQPPEREVEFPRDEPAHEYPTEDERITED